MGRRNCILPVLMCLSSVPAVAQTPLENLADWPTTYDFFEGIAGRPVVMPRLPRPIRPPSLTSGWSAQFGEVLWSDTNSTPLTGTWQVNSGDIPAGTITTGRNGTSVITEVQTASGEHLISQFSYSPDVEGNSTQTVSISGDGDSHIIAITSTHGGTGESTALTAISGPDGYVVLSDGSSTLLEAEQANTRRVYANNDRISVSFPHEAESTLKLDIRQARVRNLSQTTIETGDTFSARTSGRWQQEDMTFMLGSSSPYPLGRGVTFTPRFDLGVSLNKSRYQQASILRVADVLEERAIQVAPQRNQVLPVARVGFDLQGPIGGSGEWNFGIGLGHSYAQTITQTEAPIDLGVANGGIILNAHDGHEAAPRITNNSHTTVSLFLGATWHF